MTDALRHTWRGVFIGIILALLFVVPAFAQTPKAKANNWGLDVTKNSAKTDGGTAIPNTGKSVGDLIGLTIKAMLSLVGSLFFLMIVYSGFLWMTAGGKTDKVEKAKQVMQSSVAGAIVVAMSYVIVKFVIDALG